MRETSRAAGCARRQSDDAPTLEIREINARDTAYLALLELAVSDEAWEEDEATTIYWGAGPSSGGAGRKPAGAIDAMVDELFAVTIEDDWEDEEATQQFDPDRHRDRPPEPRTDRALPRVPTGWTPPAVWSGPSKAAQAWAAHAARVTARALSTSLPDPASGWRPPAKPLRLPVARPAAAPARPAPARVGPPGPPPARPVRTQVGVPRSSSGRVLPAPSCASKRAPFGPGIGPPAPPRLVPPRAVGARPSLEWSPGSGRSE